MQQHVLPILLRWGSFREQLGQQFFANNTIRPRLHRVRKKSIIVREHLRREVTHSRDSTAPGKEIGQRISRSYFNLVAETSFISVAHLRLVGEKRESACVAWPRDLSSGGKEDSIILWNCRRRKRDVLRAGCLLCLVGFALHK
jgi:hypothetical protein